MYKNAQARLSQRKHMFCFIIFFKCTDHVKIKHFRLWDTRGHCELKIHNRKPGIFHWVFSWLAKKHLYYITCADETERQ